MAHILVVDDSPTDVQAIRAALEKGGHDVTIAEAAEEGVEMAKALQPSLVLMDIVFEGTSGFQGVRKLSKDGETSHIPVIIISGKGTAADKAWGLRQGAVDYLVKPLKDKQLLEAVDKALGQ